MPTFVLIAGLTALAVPVSSAASGRVSALYGDRWYVLEYDAGRYGWMPGPGGTQRRVDALIDGAYKRMSRHLDQVDAALNKARESGIPIVEYHPAARVARFKLDGDDEGASWSRISETEPGSLTRLLNGPYPVNVSLARKDKRIVLSVARRMTVAEIDTLRDILVDAFEGKAPAAGAKRQGNVPADPSNRRQPRVALERERYLLCASNSYKVTVEHAGDAEKILESIAGAVSSELDGVFAARSSLKKLAPGTSFKPMGRRLDAIRRERGDSVEQLCRPALIKAEPDSRGHRYVELAVTRGNLKVQVFVVLRSRAFSKNRWKIEHGFDGLIERALDELTASPRVEVPVAPPGERRADQ